MNDDQILDLINEFKDCSRLEEYSGTDGFDQLGINLWDQLRDQFNGQFTKKVWDILWRQLEDSLRDKLREELRNLSVGQLKEYEDE